VCEEIWKGDEVGDLGGVSGRRLGRGIRKNEGSAEVCEGTGRRGEIAMIVHVCPRDANEERANV